MNIDRRIISSLVLAVPVSITLAILYFILKDIVLEGKVGYIVPYSLLLIVFLLFSLLPALALKAEFKKQTSFEMRGRHWILVLVLLAMCVFLLLSISSLSSEYGFCGAVFFSLILILGLVGTYFAPFGASPLSLLFAPRVPNPLKQTEDVKALPPSEQAVNLGARKKLRIFWDIFLIFVGIGLIIMYLTKPSDISALIFAVLVLAGAYLDLSGKLPKS